VHSPPRQWPKPPWDALPLPPQLGVAPSSHYYGGLHPNSQSEVRTKTDEVVIRCIPFSIGDPQVTTGRFFCAVYHMKLPEVTLLELSWIQVVHGRL
jgi:hypothetical protein